MKHLKSLLVLILAVSVAACSTAPKISEGSVVKIEYTGTLADGTTFDSTEGKDPLTFLVGANQVIPAFEEAVVSIGEGGSKKFTIKAKEAYGEPDPNKVVTLPRDGRFKDIELKQDSVIFANNKGPDGKVVQTPMKVVKLTEKEVTMDYNHPLAGKNLTFDVKVVEVREPQVNASTAKAPEAEPQVTAKPSTEG